MSNPFRLAVISTQDGDEVVVESNGKLLPVLEVLGKSAGIDLGLDVDSGISDIAPILEKWEALEERLVTAVDDLGSKFQEMGMEADAQSFRPPLAAPGKIICIGANYRDHIEEMGIPMAPSYPYSFLKPANNTLRGSGDKVLTPKTVKMFDWEAELGVIIGQECRDVPASDALSVIAGYTNFNDLSARDCLENRPPIGVDWVWHKAYDGFAPMGPYMLPARFVSDPQDMFVHLSVNGVMKQDSNTNQMVFGVAAIIEHLSSIMTLYPGDVIATGTPAGVGQGCKPPEFLKAGDEVCMEIEGLGKLITHIYSDS